MDGVHRICFWITVLTAHVQHGHGIFEWFVMEGFEIYSSITRASVYQQVPKSITCIPPHIPPYTTNIPPYTTPHTTVYHPHIPPYTTPHTTVYHPYTTVYHPTYHRIPPVYHPYTKNYQKLPKTTKTFQSLPILPTSIDSRNSDHFEDVIIIAVVFKAFDRCSFLLWWFGSKELTKFVWLILNAIYFEQSDFLKRIQNHFKRSTSIFHL